MHLDDEEIASLIDGRADKKIKKKYLVHISNCRECFEVYTESLKTLKNINKGVNRKRILMVVFSKKRYIPVMAAAILLFIFTFNWNIVKTFFLKQQATELQEIFVEKGTQKMLTLSDATKVVLDAGSSLKYPKKFSTRNRKVFLTGEGYFEVNADKARPFIVQANHAEITVLGTKFNIRAWQQHQKVKVAVVEGKVSLRSKKTIPEKTVLITKGELSVLPKNGHPSKPRAIKIGNHLGWLHRDLFFENIPLSEILQQLERWYDVSFVVGKNISVSEQITLHIKDKPVEDIIELISDILDLKFKKKGQTIYLYQKNNIKEQTNLNHNKIIFQGFEISDRRTA